MDNHTVEHYTTVVSTCPTLRGAKHFPSILTFLCLVCRLHSIHIFLLHKSNADETQTPKKFTDNQARSQGGQWGQLSPPNSESSTYNF